MDEKLELKYLAPYLPYGLKLLMESEPDSREPNINDLEGLRNHSVIIQHEWEYDYTEVKPILRPLCQLTEDERFELAEILGCLNNEHFLNAFESDGRYNLNYLQAWEVREWLLSKHVDIFGLLDKGLAKELK